MKTWTILLGALALAASPLAYATPEEDHGHAAAPTEGHAAPAEDHAAEAEAHAYKEISAEELKALIESDKSVVVIDSRGEGYFDGEVIEGAKVLSAQDANEESLAKIIPSKDAKVVFYCTNLECPASKISVIKAEKAGYSNLYKYAGGIEDWKAKGYPTTKVN